MSVAPRRHEWLTVLAIAVAMGAWFHAPTWATIDWTDEGQIVYPSWRVAQGALPYRDLPHMYSGSLFYLHATLFRLFGFDLAVLRTGLLAVKIAIGVMIYVTSRRLSTRSVALALVLAYAAVWGTALWVFNTPYANHYGTALSLAGLVAFGDGTRRWRFAMLGLAFGVAATFKQTQGVFALLGLVLATIARGAPTGPPLRPLAQAHLVRAARLGALALVLLVVTAYLRPQITTTTGVILFLTVAVPVGWLVRRELRRSAPGEAARDGLLELATAVVGFALPLVIYLGWFWWRDALGDLIFSTIRGLPQLVHWFDPLPIPSLRTALLIATLGLSTAFAGMPPSPRQRATGAILLIAAGAVVGSVIRSPGPRIWLAQGRWMQDVFAVWPWIPFLVLAIGCYRRTRTDHPLFPFVLASALGALLQLYPAADLPHVAMTLPVFLPVLAGAFGRAAHRPRAVFAVAAVWMIVLCAPVVLSARSPGPRPAATFARARGVWSADPRFPSAAALVDWIHRREPRPRALFIPANEQLLYFLADLPSAVEHEEFVLYLLEADLIAPEDARRLVPEERLLAGLATTGALVVDDARSPRGATPRLLRTYPLLAARLGDYTEVTRFGDYRVLAPPASP